MSIFGIIAMVIVIRQNYDSKVETVVKRRSIERLSINNDNLKFGKERLSK